MSGIPHIKHTPELEDAMIAVVNAHDSQGRPIILCGNAADPHKVEAAIAETTQRFTDPGFFMEHGGDRLTVCNHLILLATLYREHLKAGNVA